jgi:hypothetical protein
LYKLGQAEQKNTRKGQRQTEYRPVPFIFTMACQFCPGQLKNVLKRSLAPCTVALNRRWSKNLKPLLKDTVSRDFRGLLMFLPSG